MEKFIQLGEKFGLEGAELLAFVEKRIEEERQEKRQEQKRRQLEEEKKRNAERKRVRRNADS